MPLLLTLILLASFESGLPLGGSAAMLAGNAHPDWRHALTHNPSLASDAPRWAVTAGYSRPYGLAGVNQARLAGAAGFGRWSVVAGVGQLGFDRYYEREFGLAGAFRLSRGVTFGAAGNLLAVSSSPVSSDAAVALDAGVTLGAGRYRFAAAAARFNRPRFAHGDELPAQLRCGLVAEPLEDLAAALDIGWDGTDAELALGLELRLLPQLAARCGGSYPPLGYAAGLGLSAGPVTADYAFRYHAQLRDSHILGLSLSCW